MLRKRICARCTDVASTSSVQHVRTYVPRRDKIQVCSAGPARAARGALSHYVHRLSRWVPVSASPMLIDHQDYTLVRTVCCFLHEQINRLNMLLSNRIPRESWVVSHAFGRYLSGASWSALEPIHAYKIQNLTVSQCYD